MENNNNTCLPSLPGMEGWKHSLVLKKGLEYEKLFLPLSPFPDELKISHLWPQSFRFELMASISPLWLH